MEYQNITGIQTEIQNPNPMPVVHEKIIVVRESKLKKYFVIVFVLLILLLLFFIVSYMNGANLVSQ